MDHRRHHSSLRPVLLSAVPATLTLVVYCVINAQQRWALLRVPTMGQSFGDLRQITATSECLIDDPGWSFDGPTCDPFDRPYNYPAAIARVASTLNVRADDTDLVGYLLIVILAAAIGVLTYIALRGVRRPVAVVVSMSMFAVSPPVALGAERGNFDVVVFALVVGFAVACIAGSNVGQVLTLAAAIAVKLFPVGAAVGLLAVGRRTATKLAAVAGIVAVVLLSDIDSLRRVLARTPQDSQLSFGVSVVPIGIARQFDIRVTATETRVIGVALFVVVFAVVLFVARRQRFQVVTAPIDQLVASCRQDPTAMALILIGSGVFLVAYLLGTNYDYRLIFLGLVVAGVARLLADRRSPIWMVAVPLVLVFVTYPVGRLQYAADLAWLIVAPCMAYVVVRLLWPERAGWAQPAEREDLGDGQRARLA